MNNPRQLRQEIHRLQRCMDFVSQHPALDKRGKEGRRLAEVYQQLGRVWELLALQCRHRAGWRKLRDGTRACKVCGTLAGTRERWLLLPRAGTKTVGRMTRPTTKSILPTRKAATVLKDVVNFHGARLSVEVLNPHRSRLFLTRDISVAADRLVNSMSPAWSANSMTTLSAFGSACVGEVPNRLTVRSSRSCPARRSPSFPSWWNMTVGDSLSAY